MARQSQLVPGKHSAKTRRRNRNSSTSSAQIYYPSSTMMTTAPSPPPVPLHYTLEAAAAAAGILSSSSSSNSSNSSPGSRSSSPLQSANDLLGTQALAEAAVDSKFESSDGAVAAAASLLCERPTLLRAQPSRVERMLMKEVRSGIRPSSCRTAALRCILLFACRLRANRHCRRLKL